MTDAKDLIAIALLLAGCVGALLLVRFLIYWVREHRRENNLKRYIADRQVREIRRGASE